MLGSIATILSSIAMRRIPLGRLQENQVSACVCNVLKVSETLFDHFSSRARG